jgi:hypothetical protein
MSAKADALRIPGRVPTSRSAWYIVAALIVAVAVALTVFVVVSRNTATSPERVSTRPNSTAVQGDGTVGSRPHSRFHSLPDAGGSGAAEAQGADVRVGGSGTYQHHPLP